MVKTPLILSYEDTLALPAVDVTCPLICNGNPRMSTASWRGVSIQTLLERLNIRGRYARFVAADGYVTGLSIEKLTNAVLAYMLNGEPLPVEHGFPARLIVPGLYGYKMPKWITRVELTDTLPAGYWETRGWSATGEVQPTAVIVTPFHRQTTSDSVTIRGNAFAGEREVKQIEVSIDNGPWMPVPFEPAPRYCLIEWQIEWKAPAPADYLIQARAVVENPRYEISSPHGVVVRVVNV